MNPLREKALAALGQQPRAYAPVYLPELGYDDGETFVRTLTVGERANWLKSCDEEKADATVKQLRFAILVLVDHAGDPIFEESDLAFLRGAMDGTLERITSAAVRLRDATAKEVEEYRQNFRTSRNGSSLSDSPLCTAAST